jgi:hypothetical protein
MTNTPSHLELGLYTMKDLLGEFRAKNIGPRPIEEDRLQQCLAPLSQEWNARFPGLPEAPFAYSSLKGISRRGQRDEYLKDIIAKCLNECTGKCTIVNPVCVDGRHARDLAQRLPNVEVTATDINAQFERFYRHLPWVKTPPNYVFQQDDIFNPQVQATPTAVVFFGACGSLSDAAMDNAINAQSPRLICRTCCHDNIGGNTEIVKGPGLINLLFRLKNLVYSKKCKGDSGEYFAAAYGQDHYPSSKAGRNLSDSMEFVDIARHTVDSDICRNIIDLDRYLHLIEAGYRVWYRAEMFVAEKTAGFAD